MKKQTQILIGLGVLGVGGFLYWKSKQPKSTDTVKKMVGADGAIFKPTSKEKVFKGADGEVFKQTPTEQVFKGADGAKPLPTQFFKSSGSGWVRNMAGGQMDTQNSGNVQTWA